MMEASSSDPLSIKPWKPKFSNENIQYLVNVIKTFSFFVFSEQVCVARRRYIDVVVDVLLKRNEYVFNFW